MNLQSLRTQYKADILRLAEQHKAEHVRVFGSVVRHDHAPDSDIDLLVHFKPGASLFDWVGLEEDLQQLFGCPVDVLSDRAIRDELAPYILRDAVAL